MHFKMYSRIPYILILTYIHYGAADFMTKNVDNYGPYEVSWDHYDACRGPKMVNLTTFATKLSKTEDGTYRGELNMTFFDNTRIEEFRISVYTLKDKSKTILWNYIINKPCKHYMLAAFLETQFGVQNCVVKKGDYFLDLNLTALMINYLGNSFFYGEYLFKVIVTSKKGNAICLIFDPKFKKKAKIDNKYYYV